MEEARRVLVRLERIDTLERRQAPPGALLAEVRALLAEAEAWVQVDRGAPDSAADAVERCRNALEGGSRTLLA